MLDLFLVRHSITYGNTLGRYIGKRTDEPLTEDGIALVKHRYYPQVQAVFTSPLKRCRSAYANHVSIVSCFWRDSAQYRVN